MFLLLNTAAAEGFVALADKKGVIKTVNFKRQFGSTDPLLPAIDVVLKKAKIKLSAVKQIAAVSGPGSFAGLRTGLSAANTIAWSLQIPIIGVPTSEATTPEEMYTYVNSKKAKKVKRVMPEYGSEPNITLKPKPKN